MRKPLCDQRFPATRCGTLTVRCAKRTGKRRYPSEKKRLDRRQKEQLRQAAPEEGGVARETGFWRLSKLLVPASEEPGKDFAGVSPPLLQAIAKSPQVPGPILNSGMCSEVFQFDISIASTNTGGIIPVFPIVNSSTINATRNIPAPSPAYYGKLKNRRIMYNEVIPLTGKTVNKTEPFNTTSENSKLPDSKPASSVVVSVLADPREAGDRVTDTRISSKPLSRIFIVLLLDGVRYVTYSCALPLMSADPHLVN